MRHEYEVRSAEPTETRSEDDGEELDSAVQAVEELKSSVSSFQQKADERIEKGFKEIGDRVTDLEAKLNRPGATEARKDGDDLEQRAFGKYLRFGTERMQAEELRSLTAGTDSEGGYTVPETFLNEIVKELTEISPMRQLARVTPVGGTPVLLPRRTGTPTGAWEGETTAAGETSSAYGQWSIDVHEARVYSDISNRLLEDSAFSMESEIRTDLAEAFAELEAGAFVSGDGTGKPQGLITDTDFVTATASGSALTADDLIDLHYSVKARYRMAGSWIMNSSSIAAVRKLKSSNGDYLWQDSLAAGQPPTLLGRPVVEFPDLADVGSATIPVVFGDFARGYRIVQRMAMTVMPDRFTQAASSIVRFHARQRVGGKLVLPEALVGLEMPA
ncbi:phage major capsid protein [Fodinicurvata fenggangensis]|uniref:phage major capsid protein n=1 Tax=Fodinicurvata fenggangensis TaxID=1121830 RepID=UPI00068A9B5C|nr:phage major capsid protein [Fodinicurvata fenggangensis]